MMVDPSDRSVDAMAPSEAASYWLVRQDSGGLSPREQKAFEQWLEEPLNADAYAKAQATWDLFSDDNDDAHLKAMRKAALAVKPVRRRPGWRPFAAGAVAASLLAVIAIGGLFQLVAPSGRQETAMPAATRDAVQAYETGKGESLTVTLSDGTVVMLNTDTRLETNLTGEVRTIRLLGGQAYFDVAHDAQHPFVVYSGGRRVTALGTKFDVLNLPGRFDVALLDGKVAVDHDIEQALHIMASDDRVVLRPGQKLVTSSDGERRVVDTHAERQALWRDGLVEFEDLPLADAIAEMQRYTDASVIVEDPLIGQLKVSGVFRIGQMRRFLDTVAEILPVRTRDLGNGGTRLVFDERDSPAR